MQEKYYFYPMSPTTGNISRRLFIYLSAIVLVATQWPLAACKRIFKTGEKAELDDVQVSTLKAVLIHLFPGSDIAPSANEVHTWRHIANVYSDLNILSKTRRLIRNGIRWVEESSIKLFNRRLIDLNPDEKDQVLRYMEDYKKGRSWISLILRYGLESMLGDPVYGINTNEKGWQWLNHIPGSPRPGVKNRYEPKEG